MGLILVGFSELRIRTLSANGLYNMERIFVKIRFSPALTPFNAHLLCAVCLAPLTLRGSFATYRFVLRDHYFSPPP